MVSIDCESEFRVVQMRSGMKSSFQRCVIFRHFKEIALDFRRFFKRTDTGHEDTRFC